MIGLDTNVLLRLIERSDKAQTARAETLIRINGIEGSFINAIVLCEYTWTLQRTYKFSREAIVQCIEQLLEASEFVVQSRESVMAALTNFQSGKADFADCMLAEINQVAGCFATFTFDEDAANSAGFRSMPA